MLRQRKIKQSFNFDDGQVLPGSRLCLRRELNRAGGWASAAAAESMPVKIRRFWDWN